MPRDPHEEALSAQLRLASGAARAGFAAVCAERLLSAVPPGPFDAIRLDLQRSLDTAWDYAKGLSVPAEAIERQIETLMHHVVADDSLDGSAGSAAVQEAVAASLYALRQVTDAGSQNAIYAARQLVDAADRRVQNSLGARLLASEYELVPQEREAIRAARDRQLQDLVRIVAAVGNADALDVFRAAVRADSLLVAGNGGFHES